MKIIHTSDWHIGRRFERESLEGDQRAFLVWLAGQVDAHGVDLVIVAGDIYDRALPAEDAVALLDEGLDGIRTAGAQVVLIPGNHDSAPRLGFGAERQKLGGVHVFAHDQRPPVPWIFAAGEERVAVVAVPFLDPYAVPAPSPGPDGSARSRTHEHVLADAVAAGRSLLDSSDPVPSICVAHAFVSGAEESGSERALSIGGADRVDPAIFAGFDYVALGHLHRPQRISGDTCAYSGSPLPYSFSETHPKSVRLLDVDTAGLTDVTTVPIPVGRGVTTLTGTLDGLLADPDHQPAVADWVCARLTDDTIQTQPLERLRARFPHVVHVRYDRPESDARSMGVGSSDAPHDERPAEDVIAEFLVDIRGRGPSGSERTLVREALATAAGSQG